MSDHQQIKLAWSIASTLAQLIRVDLKFARAALRAAHQVVKVLASLLDTAGDAVRVCWVGVVVLCAELLRKEGTQGTWRMSHSDT